jgi:hypothetical protein
MPAMDGEEVNNELRERFVRCTDRSTLEYIAGLPAGKSPFGIHQYVHRRSHRFFYW